MNPAEIRAEDKIWEKLRSHLFSSESQRERFAFLLSETVKLSDSRVIFLVNDCILIDDKDVDFVHLHAEIKIEKIIEIINIAVRKKKSLVEVHNHNGCYARFSRTDQEGFNEFVPYVLDSLGQRPYAAIVMSNNGSVEGLFWQNQDEQGQPIHDMKVIGDHLEKLQTSSNSIQRTVSERERYKRQILLFGKEGQRKIAASKVGIVGLGGLGSHVWQQLAYLGVRDFVLVDPDSVEENNLNRLIGAGPSDAGEPKILFAKRNIDFITGGRARVNVVERDLRSAEALDSLKQVDVIFGCVDNDGPRLILNELALAYLINYIDCSSGVNSKEENASEIESAGGRIVVFSPGGPCLLCANEIDLTETRDFLSSEDERANSRLHGYVKDVDAPSVVSLNGIVASMAVTEFMALVAGVRSPAFYTSYDLLCIMGASVTHRTVPIDLDCLHHSQLGIGDKIMLERYLLPVRPKIEL